MLHGILQLGLIMRSFHGVITTRGSDLCGEAFRVQAEEEKQGLPVTVLCGDLPTS